MRSPTPKTELKHGVNEDTVVRDLLVAWKSFKLDQVKTVNEEGQNMRLQLSSCKDTRCAYR